MTWLDPKLCNPNLHQDLGIHSSYSKLLDNKIELNFKTLREIFHSLLNLMGGRIVRWEEIQERNMMWLTVPILTWLCTLRRPPAQGAQATSCFFSGSKYSGKFRFLVCSGDREPLVIYALTYPSFPVQATKRYEKDTKVSIKTLPSSVSLVNGLWSFSEYRKLNGNLFLESWLKNQADLHGHLRSKTRLLGEKTANNIMKMDIRGHARQVWFHVIFLATSGNMHYWLRETSHYWFRISLRCRGHC